MVENIHIIKSHSFEACVKACGKILFASPIPVRTFPHRITRFCTYYELVTVRHQFFPKNTSEINFGTSGLGTVVVGKVKVSYPVIERSKAKLLHIRIRGRVSEIMPKSERYCGKLQTALAASVVNHIFVSVSVRNIHFIFTSVIN